MWKKIIFEVYLILYMVCLLLTVAFLQAAKVYAAAFFNVLMWIFSTLAFIHYGIYYS